ncbi:MDR family MFS transporter [Pseudarthrobacter sp. PS3-L1]|uniref:MDR family MFS transporter n=1 Tax=Pseudarthrobacter sp. PS3-L1 TaxID=3046207 RepID=UPI0024B99B52|nr:MDR family MFS transporter [Pseudarthrobacter sp. PS3-L1]MDJ0319427.1 MDR family MFS transporter [Pseudarthrobacter sp. PS3-L1]
MASHAAASDPISKAGAPARGAAPAAQPEEPMTHRQILEALTGLLAALFTAILSSTIVANALPTIMAELNGTQTDFAWVITASLLASAATTPIWGKLADLFDKKLLVQLSIVIFVAGSVMAGLSHTIPLLLTARVIQGIAMGGLTALAQAIIGSMIPPRDRGKYSGYMGGVMALGTAGGPLLGGLIVDSPLGWRWTFFVCVPLAIVALILLQVTLKIKHVRRPAKIDWLGSVLLTSGVSLLLIWVSFAGKADHYDWISWQSAVMVGGGIALLALLVLVESKVAEPIIPLKIISQRTTALAIIASVAVGVAMFGSSSFLGQYYQLARGATPTEAGLLTLPMIAGNLIGSVASGQLISRTGKWKRYLIAGGVLLTGGLGMAGTMDHTTELWHTGVFTFILGLGLGLLMQNLVLAVQNTVKAKDIGTASASVAFFRSVGGAIGVSVLGAVLGSRVTELSTKGFADAGITIPAGAAGSTLDVKSMPEPVAEIIRAAYGDATAQIFLIAAIVAVAALISVLFIKEQPLRRTVDVTPATTGNPAVPGVAMSVSGPSGAVVTSSTPIVSPGATPSGPQAPASSPSSDFAGSRRSLAVRDDLDREFDEILGRQRSGEAGRESFHQTDSVQQAGVDRSADQLLHVQQLLAEQQLQLSRAFTEVQDQALEQRRLASEQAETAEVLRTLSEALDHERERQEAAAHYLATGGRHSASS